MSDDWYKISLHRRLGASDLFPLYSLLFFALNRNHERTANLPLTASVSTKHQSAVGSCRENPIDLALRGEDYGDLRTKKRWRESSKSSSPTIYDNNLETGAASATSGSRVVHRRRMKRIRVAKHIQEPSQGMDGPADSSSDECYLNELGNETPTCPWCRKKVDKEFASLLFEYKRPQSFREQRDFHERHEKLNAQREWKQREYPVIDWDILKTHFPKHSAFLRRIISGTDSYYCKEYGKILRDKTIDDRKSISPGYFGPRGADIMSDYIVGEFADLLREKAPRRNLISKRGAPMFIQRVLVLELASRVIVESMGVGEADAHRILDESRGFGDILSIED